MMILLINGETQSHNNWQFNHTKVFEDNGFHTQAIKEIPNGTWHHPDRNSNFTLLGKFTKMASE